MAVLVEGISVVIRKDSIQHKLAGGETRFRKFIPNSTYCDGELARVGFLNPADVESFVNELQNAGLSFMEDGQCIDIAICDQQRGPTTNCHWLEFAHLPFEGGKVGAAWIYEGKKWGSGIHMSSANMTLATPAGWRFEGSLSDQFEFVPDDTTFQ